MMRMIGQSYAPRTASMTKVISATLIAAIFSGSVAQAADCTAIFQDVSDKLVAFQDKSTSTGKGVKDDYTAATNSSYAKSILDAFEALNKNSKQAMDLVGQGYDLASQAGLMSEGQIQKALPPAVPITMSNAVALAQAAADEDKTKLDVAQLRCDQNTEDAALGAWLDQQSSDVQSAYRSTKRDICKAVHILAELQDAREKLNDIRQNGYPLFFLHVKEKKTFASSYKRTIQFKVDLRMYPTYPDSVDVKGEDQEFLLGKLDGIRLSYNSYFKWSDDNWTKLNLYQAFVRDTRKDDYICLPPKISLGSASVELCVKVGEVTTSKATVHAKAKFRYKSDTKSIGLGSTNIPAPFGYLAKVSDMKEKKMQELQSKLVRRMADLLGVHSDLLDKAAQWKNTCS